jgi:hypothetical protein
MDCVHKEYYRTRSFSPSGGKAKVTACGVEKKIDGRFLGIPTLQAGWSPSSRIHALRNNAVLECPPIMASRKAIGRRGRN